MIFFNTIYITGERTEMSWALAGNKAGRSCSVFSCGKLLMKKCWGLAITEVPGVKDCLA